MLEKINKMKRIILLLLLSIIFSCSVFPEKPKKIAEYDLGEDFPVIGIYQSISNATTTESIQVRTDKDWNNAKHVYEKYDVLLNHILIGDSIRLILTDTSSSKIRVDTFFVDVNSLR